MKRMIWKKKRNHKMIYIDEFVCTNTHNQRSKIKEKIEKKNSTNLVKKQKERKREI